MTAQEETQRRRKPRPVLELSDNPSGHERNLFPVVREGVRVLDPKNETFEERTERLKDQRTPYAPMHAHMEMSAIVLAAGGTFKMAANRAGVSVRQVKKYYESRDFRARIEELRSTMLSKVRGRVARELERRTEGGAIQHIEFLDLLRLFDRVYGPPGSKNSTGVQILGDVNVNQNNYDTLIQALLAPESGTEGTDFPGYEPSDFSLPSGSSPLEG